MSKELNMQMEEERDTEQVDVNSLHSEDILRLHELNTCRDNFLLNPLDPILLLPEIVDEQIEKSYRKYIQAQKKYEHTLRNNGENHYSTKMKKTDIDYASNQLSQTKLLHTANNLRLAHVREYLQSNDFSSSELISDENIIDEFLSILAEKVNIVFDEIQDGEFPTQIYPLIEIIQILDIGPNNGTYYETDPLQFNIKGTLRILNSIENSYKGNWDRFCVKSPYYGSAFENFIRIQQEKVQVQNLPNNTLCLLDNGLMGYVIESSEGQKVFKILLQHNHPMTGLPASIPFLNIINPTGDVTPTDIFSYEKPRQPLKIYENIIKEFREKGISKIKTHIFDSVFLIQALKNGHWSLPSIGGFQVESRKINSGKSPEFQYFNPESPYSTFIFDGDLLEQQFPITDSTNTRSGFHFIPDGLPFSHAAFKYCIVNPNLRKQLMKWFNAIGKEEQKRILGDKSPEDFFVTEDSF